MDAKKLPVYTQRNKILSSLSSHQVVIVESPTGSGKTTQLPVILEEAGYAERGTIGVTQPRRIATLSVSDYIAKQLGVSIPGFVGYKMRFDDKTLPSTRLKIMTDGILLQEIKNDPLLTDYSVMIVDEAHERSLNIDFVLGLLKNILRQRPEFKVIISSATLNTKIFQDYFWNCPIIKIDTITYPVSIIYDSPSSDDPEDLITKIVSTVERYVGNKGRSDGDILIFLPGEKLIKDTVTALKCSQAARKLFLIPLYGRLSREEQEKIFIKTPLFKTKVVVSTNIAETSVTIDGITVVIDSGLSKLNYYNPNTFTSSLIESPVSRASSDQRKGRAGRTGPGSCYRLYKKKDFEARTLYTPEEIFRTDLSEVVLRMSEIGIRDFHAFDFLSSPGKKGLKAAVETLRQFNALESDNSLSPTGEMMVKFPLLPRHSRMIVEGIMRYPDVLDEVITATSFISTRSPYLLPQGEELEARNAHHSFADENGDFASYLKLFKAFNDAKKKDKFCKRFYLDEKIMHEIVNIHSQLSDIVSEMGIPIGSGGSVKNYLMSLAAGLIQFVCVKSGRGIYSSSTADRIIIHPGSVMFKEYPPYIVAGEIVKTSRMYARSVSPLNKRWVKELLPELLGSYTTKGNKRETLKKLPKRKDTTNEIHIGNISFSIKKVKGKKFVEFTWSQLSRALQNIKIDELPSFNRMRGVLYWKGNKILNDAKVNTILQVSKKINPDSDFIKSWNQSTYHVETPGELKALIHELKHTMKLCPYGKQKNNTLGFLSLNSDTSGHFWFKATARFSAALNQSISAVEALFNAVPQDLPEEELKEINTLYRKLDQFYL